MVLNSIEKLLAKYESAETTLKEEAQLRDYFNSENVAPHLEQYKPMFVYFAQNQKEEYTKDVPLKPRFNYLYQWISVAAVAILMLGVFLPKAFGPSVEEKEQALLAYNQTLEALSLVSVGMQKGKEEFNSIVMISDHMDDGLSQAGKLNEFSKAKNKIFKNN